MHKHILFISVILLLSVVCSTVCWLDLQFPVQKNTCKIEDLVEDPSAVRTAILKMGPYKQYIITADGKLLVEVNNKWLRLHYNKEG
jgi:hypothetical protein